MKKYLLAAVAVLVIGEPPSAQAGARQHHHTTQGFDMARCLKLAARYYADPLERKSVCDDMKVGA